MIGKNIRVSSSDIATHWDVSQKTAKRDIADLKQKELVSSLNFIVDSGQLTNVQNAIDSASLNFMVNRNFQIL